MIIINSRLFVEVYSIIIAEKRKNSLGAASKKWDATDNSVIALRYAYIELESTLLNVLNGVIPVRRQY